MSHKYNSSAERGLVQGLKKTRKLDFMKGLASSKVVGAETEAEVVLDGPTVPRPPSLSEEEEEKRLVNNLDKPVSTARGFPKLEQLKVAKKDRHIKALDGFTKMLDDLADRIEQDLLQLSRDVRDNLEDSDAERAKVFVTFLDADYMTAKSEEGVMQLLATTKARVDDRARLVETFALELDELERMRADTVGKELKMLVDKLIGIAHQLPDEIEHIVETETFELNKVLTSNRKAHSQLMGIMRKAQVEAEVEGLQLWENARRYWRQLRHDKALKDFATHVDSDEFVDPKDRQALMLKVRQGQMARKGERQRIIRDFMAFDALTITSEEVKKLQGHFTAVAEEEIEGVQACYNSLTDLKSDLKQKAEERVESLRKELHGYGALHDEPDFKTAAAVFHEALTDENVSETWRLGGGLKPEFTALAADFVSENIVYEPHVESMEERLHFLTTGFPLRAIMEDRGQLSKLDKTRTLIVKLRTVPRAEIPDVLDGLMPDLSDMREVEALPELFISTLKEIEEDMQSELDRVAKVAEDMANGTLADTGTQLSTTMGGTVPPTPKGGTRGSTRGGAGMTGGTTGVGEMDRRFVDSISVKQWNRRLGILFYGSELPEPYRLVCEQAFRDTKEQRECNMKVDAVVLTLSANRLVVLQRRYKKLIDRLATYLENQAGRMAVSASNIGDFFLAIARLAEAHRTEQQRLDDKNEDDLFDWKEDFRLALEDREIELEAACDKIRQSITHEELVQCFQFVLGLLDGIQESYRKYHGRACFLSDRYPLSLAEEFNTFLANINEKFVMEPIEPNPIIHSYKFLDSEMLRLNKSYVLEEQETARLEAEAANPTPKPVEGEEEGTVEPEAEVVAQSTDEGGEEEGETVPAPTYAEIFPSPNLSVGESAEVYAGRYGLPAPVENFADSFFVEKDEVDEVADATNKSEVADEAEPDAEEEEAAPVSVNPLMPWLVADFEVKPADELAVLDEDDLVMYETALVAAQTPVDEEAAEEAVAAREDAIAALEEGEELPAPDESEEVVWTKEMMELYRSESARLSAMGARLAKEADAEYIRCNPPLRPDGAVWVHFLEISNGDIVALLQGMRGSLIAELESEAYNRVAAASRVNTAKKNDFTDELEDRLRTHWPRRGRVETQIKQPREAELLGHEEKTWRHIQAIQDRTIDIKARLDEGLNAATATADQYTADISRLRESFVTKGFRTLAALQGVDAKARSTLINFQNKSVRQLTGLKRLVGEETDSIVHYAFDFRKVCPPQEKGKEGGYSPAELDEIEGLVKGQCDEIAELQEEWAAQLEQLATLQQDNQKIQETFQETYEKAVQELSLSEGLGQKYGAPRRRAQERLRTEVTRDEQSAGKLDEVLAQLEFFCSEEARVIAETKAVASNDDDSDAGQGPEDYGKADYVRAQEMWQLLKKIRTGFATRADYLKVLDAEPELVELEWLEVHSERLLSFARGGVEISAEDAEAEAEAEAQASLETGGEGLPKSTLCFQEVIEDVDQACRAETKELYIHEGREDALGGDIPESLQKWLGESREKLVGHRGHREKAWKRLWGQVARLEIILNRKVDAGDDGAPTSGVSLGAPTAILSMLSRGFIAAAEQELNEQEVLFLRALKVLEKGREKHERLLRPRLGSPDAAAELQELDRIETERSNDTISSVNAFRSAVVVRMAGLAKDFSSDLCLAYKGLMGVVDSTVHQEMLVVPPETAVPKKRLTLKRMRKAQRVRDAVASGEEDWTKARIWGGMPLERLVQAVQGAEPMVEEIPVEEAPVEVEDPKAKKGKKGKEPEPETATEDTPTMVPAVWMEGLAAASAVRAGVSTAHRALVAGRDASMDSYVEQLSALFDRIRTKYDVVLQQESSWNERWQRQVGMLRSGNL
jgi:hypothetical protein